MNKTRSILLGMVLSAGLYGQDMTLDPSSSVRIDLPPDSPVTLISTDMGQSRATARGGALVMDLHMKLTLRNSGTRRVRGVTLLITAQEFAPGGKGSVARPCIDVASGENFSLPVEIRLVRPVQQASGPLVHVQLDGVLFDDLSFFGPNRLNSQRAMTFWEVEAQRDRTYFKQVLKAKGEEGLRKEVLAGLASQGDRPQMDVTLARNGRSVALPSAPFVENRMSQFAFLSIPDSPILPVHGQAEIAGDEARSPQIEIQNLDARPVRYVEIGWVVKDKDGTEYVAGSVPGSSATTVIPPGQRGKVVPESTLKFSRGGRAIEIQSLTGFVSQVQFEDGKVWVPTRKDLDSSPLLRTMTPSTEEQRLLDIYSKKGMAALVADLSRY